MSDACYELLVLDYFLPSGAFFSMMNCISLAIGPKQIKTMLVYSAAYGFVRPPSLRQLFSGVPRRVLGHVIELPEFHSDFKIGHGRRDWRVTKYRSTRSLYFSAEWRETCPERM